MRAPAVTISRCFTLVAVALAACGKSTRETPPATGASAGKQGSAGDNTAGGSVGDAAGGSGDGTGTSGSSAEGTGAGGVSGALGSGGAGGRSGRGAASGGQPSVCDDQPGFVKIAGELPGGFGSDVTLSNGCSDLPIGARKTPVSYTHGPGDTGGRTVRVVACSDDGSLKVDLSLNFPAGNPALQSGSLAYFVDGVLRGIQITDLNETQKPVSDWGLVAPSSTDGVGQRYEASFSADGSPTGTQVNVTGTFSVCHAANLP
jgi:hypothetical protein